jgi:hypothetical protein
MTNKALISPAFEKGHFDGLVDEGKYLRQSSLYKQILPRPVNRSFSEGGTPSRLKTICLNTVNLVKKTSCLSVFVAKIQRNPCNPRFINDLRSTKVYVRKNKLFMQNKANFQKVKSNLNKKSQVEPK